MGQPLTSVGGAPAWGVALRGANAKTAKAEME